MKCLPEILIGERLRITLGESASFVIGQIIEASGLPRFISAQVPAGHRQQNCYAVCTLGRCQAQPESLAENVRVDGKKRSSRAHSRSRLSSREIDFIDCSSQQCGALRIHIVVLRKPATPIEGPVLRGAPG